jgi:hypothetical protein
MEDHSYATRESNQPVTANRMAIYTKVSGNKMP